MIMDAFQPAGDIPTGCCVSNECGSIRHQSGTHFRYARRPLHHPSPLLCIAHAHINDSCIVCLQAVQQQQLSTTYRSKLLQKAASHRVQRRGRLSLGCRQRWRLASAVCYNSWCRTGCSDQYEPDCRPSCSASDAWRWRIMAATCSLEACLLFIVRL